MKNYIFYTLMITILLFPVQSFSMGIGASGTVTYPFALGGGLLIDTAAAKNMLLSYRMVVSYNKISNLEGTSSAFDSIDAGILIAQNSFAFGLLRRKSFRLYIGPLVGIAFTHHTLKNSILSTFYKRITWK